MNIHRGSKLKRFVGISLPLLVAAGVSYPSYRLARSWSLHREGWKVIATPEIVLVSRPSSSSPGSDLVVESTAELRSIADRPVRVIGVQCSCGCITPIEHFPFTLNPNDVKSVQFQVQFDEKTKDGESFGNAVFYLDETTPTIAVEFQADLGRVE